MSVNIWNGATGSLIKLAGNTNNEEASGISYDNSESSLEATTIQDAIDETIDSISKMTKIFSNIEVTEWAEDTTYSDYPYKATITVSSITSSYIPNVIFNMEQASSGDYAPIAETGSGVVYIWSKVNDTITIPTIYFMKGV